MTDRIRLGHDDSRVVYTVPDMDRRKDCGDYESGPDDRRQVGTVLNHEDLDPATLVTSSEGPDGLHYPVLDLDFSARLVPSRTPGHFHLYLNHALTWPEYVKLLQVLAEVGIIEDGYLNASLDRGATFVRTYPEAAPPREEAGCA